ncbi:MAG: hypothetical protein ABIW80_06535, partial [Lapillicoccus sp.]
GGVLAVLLAAYAILAGFSGHTVAGWTSTVLIVASVGAVQLLCLGLLGEYIGRMYTQMQARPTYFVAYDSHTATTGKHGPTDTPLPPETRLAAGHTPVAQTPDSRYAAEPVVPVVPVVPLAPVPVVPVGSAPRVRRDEEAHAGELLDR